MARPRRPALTPRLAEFRSRRGLTQEQVAEAIGISAEMVRRHEKGLSQPIPLYRQRYSALFHTDEAELGLIACTIETRDSFASSPRAGTLDEIEDLESEILGSETTEAAIARLERATCASAEVHTQARPRKLLAEVLKLHGQARDLLRGRQRLSQKRELFRLESALLAHACVLLGDLKQNDLAEKYGNVALTFAREADSCSAAALTALAKTLRWQGRLAESADMANIGYRESPATPIRIQLASQEANAAALLGDTVRAREALSRAERASLEVGSDSGTSAWSFPTGRRAIFALAVATHTGDPDGALRAAEVADAGWASGEPMVAANWAQIRVGAGIAYLLKDSLDGVQQEVTPVLDLAPDLRVSTVTGYMDDLDARLSHCRLRGNRTASELRERIRAFNTEALPTEAA